jgi:anti-sigma B factor antagonist
MKIVTQTVGEVVVVSVDAPVEIDVGNADAFRDGAVEAIAGAKIAVVDCGFIDFFDSAGLGALLSIQKRMAERGGKLVLASVNRAVHDIFRMVGFDVVFLTYVDLPRALAALGAKG